MWFAYADIMHMQLAVDYWARSGRAQALRELVLGELGPKSRTDVISAPALREWETSELPG